MILFINLASAAILAFILIRHSKSIRDLRSSIEALNADVRDTEDEFMEINRSLNQMKTHIQSHADRLASQRELCESFYEKDAARFKFKEHAKVIDQQTEVIEKLKEDLCNMKQAVRSIVASDKGRASKVESDMQAILEQLNPACPTVDFDSFIKIFEDFGIDLQGAKDGEE